MRILYFTRDYTTHDHRFLDALSREPFEVFYLRLENDGNVYERRGVPSGIRVVEWAGGRGPVRGVDASLALMGDLQRVLDEVRPDVVHAGPVQSCGFMAALAGARPLLLMSWGSDLLVHSERDAAHKWMTRFTLTHADALLCDCDAVRDKAAAIGGPEASQVVQFPWGVELERFTPAIDRTAAKARVGANGGFLLLSTRLWEDIYGIETLLESFRLARQHAELRLLLLGAGSLAPVIEQYLRRHGLEDVVMTPGIIPHRDLHAYFQAADLYVSCARSDGASISLLEAMACGLPAVVTDSPSNREWIVPGEGGHVAPVDVPEAFARAIVDTALLPAEERDRWGARNRAIASERANWDRNVRRLFQAYYHVSGRATPAGTRIAAAGA